MKDGVYETRKEQIEAIARQVGRGKMKLRSALREAALVGACGDRDWVLSVIRGNADLQWLYDKICSKSVVSVLGYD